ncbi:hypothetical protein VTK73DRAFT_5585 [Phialemonium thermophilum]|uniref:Uncharacterized protein n=1 Tax=Phialemonium thermophilum TaxID=223376 RepID=A0ABR3V224_9PEZI
MTSLHLDPADDVRLQKRARGRGSRTYLAVDFELLDARHDRDVDGGVNWGEKTANRTKRKTEKKRKREEKTYRKQLRRNSRCHLGQIVWLAVNSYYSCSVVAAFGAGGDAVEGCVVLCRWHRERYPRNVGGAGLTDHPGARPAWQLFWGAGWQVQLFSLTAARFC